MNIISKDLKNWKKIDIEIVKNLQKKIQELNEEIEKILIEMEPKEEIFEEVDEFDLYYIWGIGA